MEGHAAEAFRRMASPFILCPDHGFPVWGHVLVQGGPAGCAVGRHREAAAEELPAAGGARPDPFGDEEPRYSVLGAVYRARAGLARLDRLVGRSWLHPPLAVAEHAAPRLSPA